MHIGDAHWVAKPTRGCYALAGVQLPERCAGNVQFSSRRVPYNRGMSRLAKNFAKMLSALQQLQEELPAAHSLHNHSELASGQPGDDESLTWIVFQVLES